MRNDYLTRTELLFGAKALQKLKNSRVAVIGLGAVGSYAAEALARSGAGALLLVDNDVVCRSNINRQMFALHSTVGMKKTDAAKIRLADINPSCSIVTSDIFVDSSNLGQLFMGHVDFVVDAIDSTQSKADLIRFLSERGIPFISSMGAAMKKDPLMVKTGSFSVIKGCPLARKIRKLLALGNTVRPDFDCVYSAESAGNYSILRQEGGEKKEYERMPFGSFVGVTGTFGLTAAAHVIRNITGQQ